MQVEILQKQHGGTVFLAQPHRLHLGAQNAAGVDKLQFILPEAWSGCTVALYLRRADGTLLAPVTLDEGSSVTVDRRLTGSTGGQWMLAALAEGYTAYTQPGSYDTYAILPTDGGTEELPPSQYEQFVARVLESASTAASAAQRAAASAASISSSVAQAQSAAESTRADRVSTAQYASRAEAAAARAEELVPTDGNVVSVNGKSGVVKLTAQDLGALPCPANPTAGGLLRVLSVDPDTGAVCTDMASMPDLTPYVRSSTVPTSTAAGAVRADPAYGVAVRADGTLTTVPPDAEALDAMTDAYAPLTPALLPRGVKLALTTAAAAAQWTADEKAAALRSLGADFSAYYTKTDIDTLLAAPTLAEHPVGSIYMSTSSASPAALFGGTWEEIASERVLMGRSSTHKAASTVAAGLPNITGSFVADVYRDQHATSGAISAGSELTSRGENSGSDFKVYKFSLNASKSSAVYGKSTTVQPAAYYVYIWRRTK